MRKAFLHFKKLSVITVTISVIIGIILIARPDDALKIVSIICGSGIIAVGVGAWISYFTKFKTALMAILGTISVIAGITVCLKYKEITQVIIFIFGVFMLISGIVDFFSSLDVRRGGLRGWAGLTIVSVITIIISLAVIFNPFESYLTLTRIIGVGLIIYAITDIIALIELNSINKAINNAVNTTDEIDVEAHDKEN